MRKMVHYVESDLLEEICDPEYMSVNFASQLVEVLAAVLDNEVCLIQLNQYLPEAS